MYGAWFNVISVTGGGGGGEFEFPGKKNVYA